VTWQEWGHQDILAWIRTQSGGPLDMSGTFYAQAGRSLLSAPSCSLRILNPPGFAEQAFLAIGELRGRLRSSRSEARYVVLWLERGADGHGNWTSTAPRDSGSQQPAIDIARIAPHGLDVHYHDVRSATRLFVELHDLYGGAGRDGCCGCCKAAMVSM